MKKDANTRYHQDVLLKRKSKNSAKNLSVTLQVEIDSLVNKVGVVGNFNPKFQPVRNKTNRENTRQRKQSHAQDNI